MKAIILAGGLGTRIAEETSDKPKPMVLINGRPILWHIMNVFASQGVTDFYVATGYLGHVIKHWSEKLSESWNVTALDTGLETQTGGRIQSCLNAIGEERVFATYGDGLGNVNLTKLLDFHQASGKLATVTAVRPPARFGVLESENGLVTHFGEKSQADAGWINGGFFVLERKVGDYISNFNEPFETGALPRLVRESQLSAFHHEGFWHPMDTLREKQVLEKLALAEKPVWLNYSE
jgi:glucose-1-phosphate cytidylyltransferase